MKDLDKKIISQLVEDADQSIIEIAEKVGASRQTVSKKIEKFKETGKIKDIKAEVDPGEYGLKVRAFVFLQEVPEEKVREENEKKIHEFSRVSRFYRLFGRYSGILEVWGENEDDLTRFVKKIHDLDGITETETFIVHSSVKESPEDPLSSFLE